MATVDTVLNREQHAVAEFRRVSEGLRHVADDGPTPGLLHFFDSMVGATAFFGVSEMHARQAERCNVLGIQEDRAQTESQASSRYNERGLRALAQARDNLREFREDLSRLEQDGRAARDLSNDEVTGYHQQWREYLVDSELTASDVAEIDNVVGRVLDFARSEGAWRRLPDFLEEQVGDLERLRRGPNRSAGNIPFWKAVAIAVYVGCWVYELFKCTLFGCSHVEAGIVLGAQFLAFLVMIFC